MRRQLLAFGLVLTLGVGCHDGPTALDAPAEVAAAPPVPLPQTVLAALHTLLDDPLVSAVTVQADLTGSDRSVQRAMQGLLDHVALGTAPDIARALATAHRALADPGAADGIVPRAALRLTLAAVQTVLDAALTPETAATRDARAPAHLTR